MNHIKSTCPHCGYENTSHTHAGPEDYSPREGDVSLCLKCALPAIFADDELQLRKPESFELLKIMMDVKVQAAIAGIERWKKETGWQPA